MNMSENATITPGFRTDHSLISLKLQLHDQKRVPGFWKLNTSLLVDKDYVDRIKGVIDSSSKFFKSQNTNPDLLWELVKAEVRGESIKYSSFKKKQRIDILKNTESQLKLLYDEQDANPTFDKEQKNSELEEKVRDIVSYENKGAIVRSKLQWLNEGERSSKFFLNLEKKKYDSKTITILKDKDDHVITAPEQILIEQRDYYEKLYTSEANDHTDTYEDIFYPNTGNKLTEEDRQLLEKCIEIEEMKNTVQQLKNNKSPGIDGLPAEFYKIFWNDIKHILFESFNFSIYSGKLSISQRQGVISLLPKPDKDPHYLKNWRPISLLTTDYKILSSTIASRLKNKLQNIIHTDQTGFLKGRYIGENVRNVIDIIDYIEKENMSGIILTIDYEKAFDKIEWNFIFKTLKYFNFGNAFINLVKLLYTDISSCCVNNGWSTQFFSLSRGVRQGCPLSPYLFILCAEILGNAIRNDSNVKGVKLKNRNAESILKMSQYADDTIFLENHQESIRNVIDLIKKFYLISGLKMNTSKTKIACIGKNRHAVQGQIKHKFPDLQWVTDKIHILGITIPLSSNDTLLRELNYTPKLIEMKNTFNKWKKRKLSLYGKNVIIKNFGGASFSYLFSVIPSPDEKLWKEFDSIVREFLWDSSTTKIKHSTLYKPFDEGGINLLDFCSFDKALKMKWIKYMIQKPDTPLGVMMLKNIEKYKETLWHANMTVKVLLTTQ